MAAGKGGNTVSKAFALAEPLAESLGLTLWDVCFEKEGANWYLRVYIDKEGGISLDDCEAFSRPFNDILDAEDFISQSYIFEAGSPGLGRVLKRPEHFAQYEGSEIKVKLIRARDGVKEFRGILKSYNKEALVLQTEDGAEFEFTPAEIAKAQATDDDF